VVGRKDAGALRHMAARRCAGRPSEGPHLFRSCFSAQLTHAKLNARAQRPPRLPLGNDGDDAERRRAAPYSRRRAARAAAKGLYVRIALEAFIARTFGGVGIVLRHGGTIVLVSAKARLRGPSLRRSSAEAPCSYEIELRDGLGFATGVRGQGEIYAVELN
jgi:hypothetical protein